ncbi:MAG: hypothetical protein AAFV93_19725, partial [Chloroflexota bacterium]
YLSRSEKIMDYTQRIQSFQEKLANRADVAYFPGALPPRMLEHRVGHLLNIAGQMMQQESKRHQHD